MNGEQEVAGRRRHNGMDHEASPEELERDLSRTRADIHATLDALEHRLSPGELIDQAIDYARGGPREFVMNLGEQARDNPMPVALITIGIGWLMFATRQGARYEPEFTSEGIEESGGKISSRGKEMYGQAAGKSKEMYGAATEKGKEMYGSAAESAKSAGETVSEKTQEMKARAGEQMEAAREGMERARTTMRRRARAMATGVRQGSEGMASGIRQSGERARGTFFYLLREQPWVLGALGVLLGASLAAGLPTTRRERETFGPARDETVNRAREIGREQMEKSREDLKQAVSESPEAHSG